ncbi:hypothetical protein CASFOL_013311 [Castilleja foliolosa]|uniref:Uncharacterized protein n=1 Tax=Castilleja foliolosa TaxID=1961234 RepID=A0ABD3DLG5_9LAMI
MAANQSNGAGWPRNVVNPDGSPADIQWSEEFECYTVNGVLAPVPLSCVPLDNDEMTPARAPGSHSRVNVEANEHQHQHPSFGESSRRSKKSTKKDVVHPMVFKLSKFLNDREKYLLELFEPDRGTTTLYRVAFAKKTTWEVSVTTPKSRSHVDIVQPVSEDPTPTIFQKGCDLPLSERLVGWTYKKNIRNNGKEEKFYYHRNKLYRSFCSLATFIIYANVAAKDLRLTWT